MTCRCGAIHGLDCPVAEAKRRAIDEAATRAWEREVRDGPAIREAKQEAARGFGRPTGAVVGLDGQLRFPQRKVTLCHFGAAPAWGEEPAHHSPPTGEGLDSFLPPRDTRQDMTDLLERMKQLVGELDRLLERTK